MSSGHTRTKPTERHYAELARIKRTPWFEKALRVERRLYRRHQIPWLGGSSTDTTRVYIDPRFTGRVDYRGRSIDVAVCIPALIEHEVTEAVLLVYGRTELGGRYEYDGAHELATAAEELVAAKAFAARGLPWDRNAYEEIFKPYLDMTSKPPWLDLPTDLNTEPYREDAPYLFHEIEREITRGTLNVVVSKADADYSKGNPEERCGLCRHYAGFCCDVVSGKIDPAYWCRYFERDNAGRQQRAVSLSY